jgi:hypothetical protein
MKMMEDNPEMMIESHKMMEKMKENPEMMKGMMSENENDGG